MKDFLERLCNVIHLIGWLISIFLIYQGGFVESQYSIYPNNISPSVVWVTIFTPILITWFIKYIFTGNKKIFPTFK